MCFSVAHSKHVKSDELVNLVIVFEEWQSQGLSDSVRDVFVCLRGTDVFWSG